MLLRSAAFALALAIIAPMNPAARSAEADDRGSSTPAVAQASVSDSWYVSYRYGNGRWRVAGPFTLYDATMYARNINNNGGFAFWTRNP